MTNAKVHTSTLCLLTIGTFDLVTTLMLLNRGMAEGNPLFAWLVPYGSLALVLGKLIFLFGPVLLLEFARTKNPKSAEQGTWVAFLLYTALYISAIRRIV